MFEKSKPIVEDLFVEKIKGQLKEGKTVRFIDGEPSNDATTLTTCLDMSPKLFFDPIGMPAGKNDIIIKVAEKLNEAQETNFIFYRPIETKLEYHYEKIYPSAKEPTEFFRFWVIFNVEKY